VMGTGFIVEAAALMRAQKFVTTIKQGGGGGGVGWLWVVLICPTARAASGDEITAVVGTASPYPRRMTT
jgi:hypothetical protein